MCALICSIIIKAGSKSDACLFISQLFEKYGGKRDLIPALVGLDESIKSRVSFPDKVSSKSLYSHYQTLSISVNEFATVFQHWREPTEMGEWLIIHIYSWMNESGRDKDLTFVSTVQSLFDEFPDLFWKYTQIMWEV